MADPTIPVPQIPPAQPTPGSPAPRSPWLFGVAGLVVGALLAGIPLALMSDSGGGGLGASHSGLSAPDALSAYTPMVKNSKANGDLIKRVTETETVSAKRLSDAYGGAGAVVRQYTDDGLANSFQLEAVRAQSPKLFYFYVNPTYLGTVKPDQDVETYGDVSCLVHYQVTPQGQQVQPDQVFVVSCERTSAHLTVRLRMLSGEDLWHSPKDLAALTDKAWAALS